MSDAYSCDYCGHTGSLREFERDDYGSSQCKNYKNCVDRAKRAFEAKKKGRKTQSVLKPRKA